MDDPEPTSADDLVAANLDRVHQVLDAVGAGEDIEEADGPDPADDEGKVKGIWQTWNA